MLRKEDTVKTKTLCVLAALACACSKPGPDVVPTRFDPDRFDVKIAGVGQLSPAVDWDLGRLILIHLHKEIPLSNIARTGQGALPTVYATASTMKRLGFVREPEEGTLYPGIPVFAAEDTSVVLGSAREMGVLLADRIDAYGADMQEMYGRLDLAKRFPWERTGLWILGAKLLGDLTIKALQRDGTLMPRPPERPSGRSGTGRYYCWMEEKDVGLSSRYGQILESNPTYLIGTFGASMDARKTFWETVWAVRKDLGREAFLQTFLPAQERAAMDSGYVPEDPRVKAAVESFPYAIPVVSLADIGTIRNFSEALSDTLVGFFNAHEDRLRETFVQIRAGTYASFGGFFRWYYHLIFCEAIDELVRRERLAMPEERFEYWATMIR